MIYQPHDKLFKKSMSDPLVAKEFMQTYLPPGLLQKIDLATLKLENHSFVDDDYKGNEADVVYSVKINGQRAYIYLLCEQQTTVDAKMPYRLLTYTVRLMDEHVKKFPEGPLPLVYPMVIYSGEKVWDAPLEVFPLFGAQEALAREWLLKPYKLVDIHRMSDDEIQKHFWCGLFEFALKYRNIPEPEEPLTVLFTWIAKLEANNSMSGAFLGRAVLGYVFSGMTADKVQVLKQTAARFLPEKLRGEAMTFAEKLEEIGEQRGLEKGMQKGMQEGEAALLMRLIQRRFGEISFADAQRIKNADADTLLVWGDRILDATTIEEIFA